MAFCHTRDERREVKEAAGGEMKTLFKKYSRVWEVMLRRQVKHRSASMSATSLSFQENVMEDMFKVHN